MSDEEPFHWEIEEYQKGLIIGFAFLLPFAFFGSAPEILQQYSSQQWPSVKGEIVEVEVGRTWDSKHEVDRYDGRVRYRYEVDGQTYTGDVISPQKRKKRPDETAARADVSQYSIGKKLPVYYDPSDTSIAVLEPGFDTFSLAMFIADMFIWICFSIASCYFIRERFLKWTGRRPR